MPTVQDILTQIGTNRTSTVAALDCALAVV